MRQFLPIMISLLCACPGFEDKHSGTYRQVASSIEEGSEPLAVEVFRYGHNVQVIVRTYEGGADPFGTEKKCSWANPTQLDEDGTFNSYMQENTTPQVRFRGRFEDGGVLKASLDAARGSSPDLELELVSDTPDDTCRTIEPRSVTAKFGNLSSTNEFLAGEYAIQNPYFGIQWISVQPIETGNVAIWTAFTPELIFAPMGNKVTANRRGFTGALNLRVEPPDDEYRTASGDTRYSIAHFIIVDDDADDDSFVGWDRATEPIIAASVRGGKRLDAPPNAVDHDRYGLALLFVEGRLDSLGRMLDIIELVEVDVDGDGEPETVDPTQHFYVAEVFAEDERIVAMRIGPSPLLTIPVTVTTEYLQETGLPLPRLFPLD